MDRIDSLEKEIAELRKTLNEKERLLYVLKRGWNAANNHTVDALAGGEPQPPLEHSEDLNQLPKWAIERYSRQILLPSLGVAGQQRLCAARVLVVGAGGLGCPAAGYLAGAGVGEIGIVDYDTVDVTNIHRQLLHGESDQNMSKVESAAHTLRGINSRIKITPHNVQLDSSNALALCAQYHLVLDCTDNVPTRYLLNDACVLTKLPLISGSALKMEGQITIYGYRANKNPKEKDPGYVGPCYRCVFPAPPPPAAVGSCSAHGVAPPVPGVIGALQALEAIKYLVGHTFDQLLVGRMLLFDGDDATFRNVRLRPQSPSCAACGVTPTVTSLLDYEQFCNAHAKEEDLNLEILAPQNRLSAPDLARKLSNLQRHLLVDVRSAAEFAMCRIDGAVNHPIDNFGDEQVDRIVEQVNDGVEVTFVCRRGNDSQLAAQRVVAAAGDRAARVRDLAGGLHAWAKLVDTQFPIY